MTVLQGIAHWASITRPNTMFDPAYKIDLSIDLKDAKVKKVLKEYPSLKDRIKNDEDRGDYINFKRLQFRKDGTENFPPKLVDSKKNPLSVTIGNGSKVNVSFNPYDYNFKGKKGVAFNLNGVQILELIRYDKEEDEFGEEDDGFVDDTETLGKASDDDLDDEIPF